MIRSIRHWAPALLAVPLAGWAATIDAADLSVAEQRGSEIYFEGTSPAGEPINVFIGEGDQRLELPGEAAVCGSCHGHDGTGRPESGVLPTNISWKYLTRSYGHVHTGGREHSPFDEDSLRTYLRTGIFPGGAKGDPSMPIYEISDRDLDDLIAYIRRVGEIPDPGVTADEIRIGTILPSSGALGEIGAVIRDTLEAYFATVNRSGGIYGRRLDLVVYELTDSATPVDEDLERWLDRERPFALVGPFTPRAEIEVQTVLSRREVPVVGPFTLHAIRSFSLNRQVFYLYPGLADQFEALLQAVASLPDLADPTLAVVYPNDEGSTQLLEILQKAIVRLGWGEPVREPFVRGEFDARSSARKMNESGVDLVLSLGLEQELRALLVAASELGWSPHVVTSGVLVGGGLRDAPESFAERLHVAYPTLPQDRKPWAWQNVSAILRDSEQAAAHPHAVISSYSSATVLVEALRRTGRRVGRREFITNMERFYEFDTGLTPPITFTSNRRIGARGAYVINPATLEGGRLPGSVTWVDSH